ncbi:kinase-like domain-containing protein [Colletotrichum acutatum]|uniref:Kinase-like domain-containing protein n=1 Tax=Glomerella acutata TaxID=27357 RepID=A0AAD8X946_GLOAC|nr:kinase-like domain-containing protein [Colletotrichum acutatum]KAK1711261.1 kinase-like domain-containing protein [Colletotrichum acutatum]
MSSDGESTQPFSDSSEMQRRLDRIAAEYQKTGERSGVVQPRLSAPDEDHLGRTCGLKAEERATQAAASVTVAELTEALTSATLASAPDAWLVLACPHWPRGADPASVRLAESADGWDVVGVVQRTHDVNFTICLPFYDDPYELPSRRAIPHYLRCILYYEPANDDCVLLNQSLTDIYLIRLGSTMCRARMSYDQTQIIWPGLWSILAVGSNNIAEQHLVDILILRRRFSVSIHKAPAESRTSTKRAASDKEEANAKRQKRNGDVTDIILASTATPAQIPIARAPGASIPLKLIPKSAKCIVRTRGTPLLDLADGESATVVVAQPTTASTASAFPLPDPVGEERIVSLQAFDGRLLAMYEEHLPPSLSRGINSPFSAAGAYAILRDMSSALTYLSSRQVPVIHNNIKPANIAYSPQRGAVLLDFGLAMYSREKHSTGGTPWYVPPDLITEGTRGAPGDIWALGVTMLYVVGKISLPEKTRKSWLIRDLKSRDNVALRYMMDWLGFVSRAREGLSRNDEIEGLVYRMLEPKSKLRIQAGQSAVEFRQTP